MMQCIAAALALAITALLVTVVFVAVTAPSSPKFKQVYSPLVAIAATLITLWISSQIQYLFLVRVDIALSRRNKPIEKLNSWWRAVLKVSTIGEQFKKHRAINLAFIGAGLISASINAGLSLSNATKSIHYFSSIPDGLVYDCAEYIADVGNTDAGAPLTAQYLWQAPNGSYFRVWPNVGTCPPRYAVELMNNINIQDPDSFAYGDLGVAVDRSAIGAPYTLYSPNPAISPYLSLALAQHGENLLEITQCVPVMTSNPVSCQTGGTFSRTPTTMFVSGGNCSDHGPVNVDSSSPAMSMGICMHDDVGQATIVLGANGGYAIDLAHSIGDQTIRNDTQDNTVTYAVTCQVDTRSAIQYRAVKLVTQGRNGINGSFARALTSVGLCQSPSLGIISDVYHGVAAMAGWQVVYQNWGYDGYFEAISETALGSAGIKGAGIPRSPPFAFLESKSALEDVLGLNSALVLSRLNSNTTTVGGRATVRFVRVGGGSRLALLYALPPFISLLTLAWLIVTTPALDHDELRPIQLEQLRSYL
jgi:hypothetical protein